jgi:hypothetical protein
MGGSSKHLRLRALTLRFFERGLGSLALLRKDMENVPDSLEACQRWVQEIREFADRAQGLAEKWESLYPELKGKKSAAKEGLRNKHVNTPTPPA